MAVFKRAGGVARVASLVAAGAVVLSCCSSSGQGGKSPESSGTSTSATAEPTTAEPTTAAPTTTSTTAAPPTTSTTIPSSTTIPPGWTESDLLSQLIMVGGEYADPQASTQMAAEGVGGFVFFGEPAAGTGATLSSEMNQLAAADKILPFMSTDEEGGQIARLANLVGQLPWAREMAEEWSPAEVTAQLTTVARQMKALGMNMDLAPVLDTSSSTNTIDEENVRSFSEDGDVAGEYGLAYWHGLQAGGIIGVVKHFPGLGHANGDTDTGPATDPPLSELETDDLIPFEQTIAQGIPVVMMSNVTEPDWGSTPASMNPEAYQFLRHLGFKGVVLTDSLDAGAISAVGVDGAQAVVNAIEAGADMAMITTPTDFPGALSGLEAAMAEGRLPLSQVIASVDRIITLKNSILPASERITPPS
ncbi:MAG: glycoside hydrolase family 3 N-terminal domain-containing protein [Acidimicrobiales bacterium]